jgi:hypothetical protein
VARELEQREADHRALVARISAAQADAESERLAAAKARDTRGEARAEQCKALAKELGECAEQRQKSEKLIASNQLRIDEISRELEGERHARDERTSAEARCLRELESRVSELGESRSRLRLCSDSLRSHESRGNDAPVEDFTAPRPSEPDEPSGGT